MNTETKDIREGVWYDLFRYVSNEINCEGVIDFETFKEEGEKLFEVTNKVPYTE